MDGDVIRSGPARRREPSDTGDAIRVGPPTGALAKALGRGSRQGRPRETPQFGTVVCWLVGDSNPGSALEPSAVPDRANPDRPDIGALAVCQWRFMPASAEAGARHDSLIGGARARGGEAWGYVEYHCIKMHKLLDPQPFPDFDGPLSDPVLPALLATTLAHLRVDAAGTTVGDVLEVHAGDRKVVLPWEGSHLTDFDGTAPMCFRSVKLSGRSDLGALLPDAPPLAAIPKWKQKVVNRASGAQGGAGQDGNSVLYEAMLLELPPEKFTASTASRPAARRGAASRPEIDPIMVINAAGFTKFLRSKRDFTEALGAAQHYDNPDAEEPRDGGNDPKRSKLEDTQRRLDVIDLLLMRRKLHADAATDNTLAINLYSDASPVAGEEIQGMLCDIHRKNGDNERVELPGCNLSYGLFDAISKSVCLLHAFWLVAGPDPDTIRYCLHKVISITTDFGTEVHTIEMVDMVAAYCAYMEGSDMTKLRSAVNQEERWLPFALRLSGWSHTLGNIMKHTAESATRWPDVLAKMRTLVEFFRNGTWRNHIQRALRDRPPPDFGLSTLDHFSVSMAKWRYETVTVTMVELLKFRTLCERYMTEAWFANVKDKEVLRRVFDACRDVFFLAVPQCLLQGGVCAARKGSPLRDDLQLRGPY